MPQHKPAPPPGRRLPASRRGLAAAAGVLACMAGGLAASPAARAAASPAHPVAVPSSSTTYSALTSVSAVSATDAWAVGTQVIPNGITQSLIEHWNGTHWAKVASPSPGGISNDTYLTGVSADSATDAWAVGYYMNNANVELSVILHWNGTSWKRVTSPNPGATSGVTFLTGVSAVSATDAWAVGSYGPRGNGWSLVLHWNGTSWKQVPCPSPGGTGLTYVSGVSARAGSGAWAVGTYRTAANRPYQSLVLDWNGTSWKQVPSPNPSATENNLAGVSAVSGTEAWAVGLATFPSVQYGVISKSVILRWNGTRWTQVTSPDPSATGNDPSGVSALSGTDAWTVGAYSNKPGEFGGGSSLTARWNGANWKQVPSPSPAGSTGLSDLQGVSASSTKSAWAVGYDRTISGGVESQTTLILHWNGTTWAKVFSPS